MRQPSARPVRIAFSMTLELRTGSVPWKGRGCVGVAVVLSVWTTTASPRTNGARPLCHCDSCSIRHPCPLSPLHAISHMHMQSSATHTHPTPPTQLPPSFFTHRVSEADGADVGVGLAAIAVGAAAKRLGRRVELHVALQANHSLVIRLRAQKIRALRCRAGGLACHAIARDR